MRVVKLKLLQRMYGLIRAFVAQKFCSFNVSFNSTPKELKIQQITKFHKLFKCLALIGNQHDASSTHSRV